MKLSDYIAEFISNLGVRHVFAINGGAALHIMDSISKHEHLELFCPHHEQSAAMAADAYSRVSENIGVAVSTSGPGATNMITGICCAWYDSVPLLLLTGQVSTFRLKKDTGVRQQGFQETSTLEICQSITKYSTMVTDPNMIRYELEKALYLAKSGRPGPVLLDIPDNIYREIINSDELKGFTPEIETIPNFNSKINLCLSCIQEAQRPVLIMGWGVHLSGARKEAVKLIESLNIPVLLTWAMKGLINDDHPLFAGTFGTHGTRYGNLAAQNSDLIISIGSRLDSHETGNPVDFAREAKKIIVDIDEFELKKFKRLGIKAECLIKSDAKLFIEKIVDGIESYSFDFAPWKSVIQNWQNNFPICPESNNNEKSVNPYVFNKVLSNNVSEDELIVCDTGCALAWTMQGFPIKSKQRIIHAFNNTPMGYALPASIGAALCLGDKSVTCITGDGALMMNIQELINISANNLNIKIILINNHGYSMICQTQDQWLNGNYSGSIEGNGLAFPDFIQVAKAHGFRTFNISEPYQVKEILESVYQLDGPVFCNVEVDSKQRVIPQVKFGYPIEDPEPFIDRKFFNESMIIPPLEISREAK